MNSIFAPLLSDKVIIVKTFDDLLKTANFYLSSFYQQKAKDDKSIAAQFSQRAEELQPGRNL